MMSGRYADLCILIPAYNPGAILVTLVSDLHSVGFGQIVVINDGSDDSSRAHFEDIRRFERCRVLEHAVNLGKGRALKTGFNHIFIHLPSCRGVVTADADGQHQAPDIARIADILGSNPSGVVVGTRRFTKDIPLRSWIGNVLTRYLFLIFIGKKVSDTQSGLRGIPSHLLRNYIGLDGEGYDYELNMLISTKKDRVDIIETPISTIYFDDNRSSHFNPIIDSMKIYFLLLRFTLSSIVASAIDVVLFTISFRMTDDILIAVTVARVFAANVNFFINKRVVFHNKSRILSTVLKYYCLVSFMGTISYLSIAWLYHGFGWPAVGSKIIVETLLFTINFVIQRDVIFYNSRHDSILTH